MIIALIMGSTDKGAQIKHNLWIIIKIILLRETVLLTLWWCNKWDKIVIKPITNNSSNNRIN